MPTGIPGSGNVGRGGYKVALSKNDLRERIKEIEARIKQMDRREKCLSDLKKWMTNRKLEVNDLTWMLKTMKPKRAAQPVRSKLPLQPTRQPHGSRLIMSDGKLVAPKGDPEFRRRILEARKTKGWNSTVVGKKVGVSPTTISGWEAGRYIPREEVRAKLVKILDLPDGLGAEATRAMEATFGNNKRGNAAAAPG